MGVQSGLYCPRDEAKTALSTGYGLFECQVMNFGINNAPCTFAMLINMAFEEFLGNCVVVYLDNIIVFCWDQATHLQHLKAILNILHKHWLKAKPSKCKFLRSLLLFLGNTDSAQGIKPNPAKIKFITNMPAPNNVGQVCMFLGMVVYVCKFISNCEELIALLTKLLKTKQRLQ